MISKAIKEKPGRCLWVCLKLYEGLVLFIILGAVILLPLKVATAGKAPPFYSPKPDLAKEGSGTKLLIAQPIKKVVLAKKEFWQVELSHVVLGKTNVGQSNYNRIFLEKGEVASIETYCMAFEHVVPSYDSITAVDAMVWGQGNHKYTVKLQVGHKTGNTAAYDPIHEVEFAQTFRAFTMGDLSKLFTSTGGTPKVPFEIELDAAGEYQVRCSVSAKPPARVKGYNSLTGYVVVFEDVPSNAFKVVITHPGPQEVVSVGSLKFRWIPTEPGFVPKNVHLNVQQFEPNLKLANSPLPVFQQGTYHDFWKAWTTKHINQAPSNLPWIYGWYRVRATPTFSGKVGINTSYNHPNLPWRYFHVGPLEADPKPPPKVLPPDKFKGLVQGQGKEGQQAAKLPPGDFRTPQGKSGVETGVKQDLRLRSSRMRSGDRLELRLTGQGDQRVPGARLLEFRLRGKKVGQKPLGRANGKEQLLIVNLNELTLPPGIRGRQTLDLYVGGKKIGAARINLKSDTSSKRAGSR
jgi:hypothetical protein